MYMYMMVFQFHHGFDQLQCLITDNQCKGPDKLSSQFTPSFPGTPDAKHRDLKDEFNKLNGYVSPRYSKLENQDDVFIKSPSSIEMKPHVSFKSKPPPLVTRTSKSSYSEREQDLEKAIRGQFTSKVVDFLNLHRLLSFLRYESELLKWSLLMNILNFKIQHFMSSKLLRSIIEATTYIKL